MKCRLLALPLLAAAFFALSNQSALSLPGCEVCKCKEYHVVRSDNKVVCLGTNANGFVVIQHAWNPGTSPQGQPGRRLAAACDQGTGELQTDEYFLYTLTGTAACNIGNAQAWDVMEVTTEDIGTLTNLKWKQRLCKGDDPDPGPQPE